jgi:hypothetical protein
MSQRLGRRRALHGIARDLADSDPRLDQLFFSFNQHVSGEEMPKTENVGARLRRLIPQIGRRVRLAAYDCQDLGAWPR